MSSRCGGQNPIVDYRFYTASLAEIEHIPICSIVNFFVEQPNGLCKPLFQTLFLLFFLRVQAKLLILLFFSSFSIYLFFNKIYIQVSRSQNTFTFTLVPAFSAGKEVLRRCVFLHGTKEQVLDSSPNILIYINFLPFNKKEHRRTKPPPRGTSPQSKSKTLHRNPMQIPRKPLDTLIDL